MDDSNGEQNIGETVGDHETLDYSNDSYKTYNNLVKLIKYSLLVGADKLLFAQRSLHCSHLENIYEEKSSKETRINDRYGVQYSDNKVSGKPMWSFLETNSSPLTYGMESNDVVAFLTVLVLKLIGFQIDLAMGFLRFPFKLLNLWLTVFIFPFQTLTWAKEHMKQKLVKMCKKSCMRLMSFALDPFEMQKSMLKLAARMCWAFFWSINVCFVLVGLLILGFVIGGIAMRNLVHKPIEKTEILNFDYTKTSPVAFVPIISSPVIGIPGDLTSKNRKASAIAYQNKLQLSISLTMPESDYNRNLGIFQVRIESLSTDGNVTTSSIHPTMLQYKSRPIQYIETLFRSIPLLTGFQSEVQNLKVGTLDFTEGIEPTACFKVTIEGRAKYEPGFGIPEVYAASMHIESQLPKLKRLIWNWRRTIFCWLSFSVFLTEVAFIVIFCRPIILPGRTLKAAAAKRKLSTNKISWNKSN